MQLPAKPVSGKAIPATWGSQIVDYLRAITPKSSATIAVSQGAGGTVFELRRQPAMRGGDSFPWDKIAFGRTFTYDSEDNVTICTIYPGAIRKHGIADHTLADSVDVNLPATDCTVYLEAQRGTSDAPIVKVAATAPSSNNSYLRIPLYDFTYNITSARHEAPFARNLGDIQLDATML